MAEVASSFLPGSGVLTEGLLNLVKVEWDRRNSECLRAAEHVSRLSREDLAERIESRPELVPLLTRLLFQAGMAGQEAMVLAMGAAFGKAALEPERIDDCEAILRGLERLRAEEVQILHLMRDRLVLAGNRSEETSLNEYLFSDLATEVRLPLPVVETGMVHLTSAGFTSAHHGLFGGGSSYRITEQGRMLFDLLERIHDLNP